MGGGGGEKAGLEVTGGGQRDARAQGELNLGPLDAKPQV